MADAAWEPRFALAAYTFALQRWQDRNRKALYVSKNIDPALWQSLKRQWPRLEREPENRPAGAQTLELENRWMYPAQGARQRFVGFTVSTAKSPKEKEASDAYQTWIGEARRAGGQWRFRALPMDPLPRAAELVLYKRWKATGKLVLPTGSERLVTYLRSQGVEAHLLTTPRNDEFLYLEVLQTWWTDPKSAYARVQRMSHPAGNDVAYESYGSVCLSRKAGRWVLTELGDWQGE